jgi:hypothetical protein
MAVSNERNVLARYFCCLITSKFAPEDVIAWCQDEARASARRTSGTRLSTTRNTLALQKAQTDTRWFEHQLDQAMRVSGLAD